MSNFFGNNNNNNNGNNGANNGAAATALSNTPTETILDEIHRRMTAAGTAQAQQVSVTFNDGRTVTISNAEAPELQRPLSDVRRDAQGELELRTRSSALGGC